MRSTLAYTGRRTSTGPEVWVLDASGGYLLDPKASQQIRNHSPDGFEWGYAGSGPSQLALAILLDATEDKEVASKHYMRFKFDFVAKWGEEWRIDAQQISEWLQTQEQLSRAAFAQPREG